MHSSITCIVHCLKRHRLTCQFLPISAHRCSLRARISRVRIECNRNPSTTDMKFACEKRKSPISLPREPQRDDIALMDSETMNPPENVPDSESHPSLDDRPSSSKLHIPELPLEGFRSLAVDSDAQNLRDLGLPHVEGVVKSYSIDRGSGFLEVDGFEQGVFVHHSQIVMRTEGIRCLNAGEKCRFFVYRTPKGLRALEVSSVDPNGFRGPSPSSRRPVKCYNCGRKGHLSKECRLKAKDVCYTCKKPGHLSADCPSNPRNRQKNPEKAIVEPPCEKKAKNSAQNQQVKAKIPSLRDALRQMEKTREIVAVQEQPRSVRPKRSRST